MSSPPRSRAASRDPPIMLSSSSKAVTPKSASRSTSPRRDSSDIERISKEKVLVMHQEAQHMQESLAEIFDRIVKVKEEYEKLDTENKFLQDYIGNLMATSM
ncbi:hypothetical protein CJU90_6404 [Yarrowia sp. C11]|nr:hypothetical protein CJU90_6404 [Yarrowia sp. C11]KAG5371104.1 hypothetical protein CKK34_1244 [Yarrowia sp. E02]